MKIFLFFKNMDQDLSNALSLMYFGYMVAEISLLKVLCAVFFFSPKLAFFFKIRVRKVAASDLINTAEPIIKIHLNR